ncbi:hypothetical protein LDG_5733 [Legionella drancourtii LLAP12]|uniref:Uncharacterized protein n=1 Tax=Legionella drancourtii LLAP12 TaxID=658187 RepID=G9EKJ8_9GAMM|nr:hypothetical protein LDG_5733 [Legionella drancourtii LLAP12]
MFTSETSLQSGQFYMNNKCNFYTVIFKSVVIERALSS